MPYIGIPQHAQVVRLFVWINKLYCHWMKVGHRAFRPCNLRINFPRHTLPVSVREDPAS